MENTPTPSPVAPVAPQVPLQPAGKSHKVLWIVLGIVAVIILLVGIALFMIGNAVSEYVDIEDGQVSIKGENGETFVVGGNALPANWPSDIPRYPGSEVGFSGSSNDENGTSGMVAALSTRDSRETVAAFYR